LVMRTFRGEPLEPFVRDFLARLRAGEFDNLLVYRKALRKPERDYAGTAPPHVRAARQLSRPEGRIVRYLMTTAGPEPAGGRQHPLDREHYVEKQLRPVAEAILSLIGSSWEEVEGRQGTLPF
jgi:DNA polymerase II